MTRTLNIRQLPSSLRYAVGGATLVALSFAFDANANVQNVTDDRPGGLDTQSYVYDQLDRLTEVTAQGRFGTALYDYDVFDNLTRSRIKGRDWRYDYLNGRLSQVVENANGSPVFGFSYDNRGNAIQAGPLGIAFDRAEVVTGIQGGQGGNESYVSDAHGHRIKITTPLGTRYPVYTRDGLLRTESSADNRRQDHHIYRGSQLIATVRNRLPAADDVFTAGFESYPQTRFVLTDHLGSNVATTDAAGNIIERSFFAPYGERLDDGVEIGPGYAGHYSDSTTLNYMKARYQSGLLGRFLSPDPVGVDPITGGHFNRYWYGNNNPVTMEDPDGRAGIIFKEVIKRLFRGKPSAPPSKSPPPRNSPSDPDSPSQPPRAPSKEPPSPATQPDAPSSSARDNASTLETGKQGKYVPGHKNYIPGRSPFTHKEPERLLREFSGKGEPVGKVPRGEPGFKERVDFGEVIGEWQGQPTTKGIIHHSKSGQHIVPARP